MGCRFKRAPHKNSEKPLTNRFTNVDLSIGVVESHFADLIWENEPISSGELVKLCAEKLQWKKPTTYTVLRRLCEKGIFRNCDGAVTSLISKKDFYAMQNEKFVNDTFDGSLPEFIAAFTERKSLSEKDIAEIMKLIESHKKD